MWTLTGFADEISDDFAEQLDLLTTLGVKHLEFRSAWGQNILLLSHEQLTQAKQMLDEAGIAVSSVGSPVGKQLITEDVELHVQGMKHAVELAHFFGARYIRGFSFFMPEGDDPAIHRDEVLRRMRLFVEIAEAGDVILLHENEKDIYGDTPERCLDLLTSIDSPNFKAIIDPANYVQCGVKPFDEAYPMMREHTVYMHMKDAIAGTPEVVPVGEGDGQVPQLIHALKESGYDGFFSLEPHLGDYTAWGAMSGPDLWTKAHAALMRLFEAEGISYR